MTGPFKNGLLQRFDPGTLARLQLRRVNLPLGLQKEKHQHSMEQITFIVEGLASIATIFADGTEIEVALAGLESLLGTSSFIGTKKCLTRVSMRIAGHGYTTRDGHQRPRIVWIECR